MSLLLLDGFEDASSYTLNGTVTSGAGGRNDKGLQTSASAASTATFAYPTADQTDTLTVGFAVKFNTALPLAASNIIQFRSDGGVTTHTILVGSAAGGLRVERPSGNLLAASASSILTPGTWYYIEFQSKLHDTTGTVTVKLNGTTVASGSSLDTKNAGTKTVYDTVVLSGNVQTVVIFDDLYITNDSTFLGDLAVETLYPNGNGNANAWVGSDGNSTDNYLLVDEAGTPATADYTGSATAGQQDLYTLSNLVRTTGSVLGVCHQSYAAKSDSGAKQFKLVNRRATDNKSGALDLTTSFAPYHYALTNDPETGSAFTLANVNALQSGVEVV